MVLGTKSFNSIRLDEKLILLYFLPFDCISNLCFKPLLCCAKFHFFNSFCYFMIYRLLHISKVLIHFAFHLLTLLIMLIISYKFVSRYPYIQSCTDFIDCFWCRSYSCIQVCCSSLLIF